MARKKDLGGLAALAGLAYMASRDKGDKGGEGPTPSAPSAAATASPAAETDPLEAANNSSTSQGIMDDAVAAGNEEKGGRMLSDMRDAGATSKRGTRSAAVKAPTKTPSTPDYGNEGRRPVKEASKPAYETPYDRSRREDREAGRDIGSVIESLKNKLTSEDTRKPLSLKSTKSETGNAFMGSGMKKGGSVKGWGIARGSRKAKNY